MKKRNMSFNETSHSANDNVYLV